MINFFEAPTSISTPEEAKKWEKYREKGLFRWQLLIGLLFAPLLCLVCSGLFFLREFFFSDIVLDDWLFSFIVQNLVFFSAGFCIGYIGAKGRWEVLEKNYQAYLKKTKI
ncbi:hypothetical protein [Agaribacter marinus]|uniref:Uncharacterized protein n=1 Tax=Agaribacter marinus TaxID=1431249 RepID=A0AA37WHB7_9ALTE|nr:hypothetical protein [Agaribacter marinus]GLR69722.1 hypothetical protein GCM10007852_06300 [Agaribacter marinus]